MTTITTDRFSSDLDVARKMKPTEPKKGNWELFTFDVVDNRADSPTKGQVVRVHGWTGGLAVLQAQVATYFNACVGRKTDSKNGDSAALQAAQAENQALQAQMAQMMDMIAKLQAAQGAPAPTVESQPVEAQPQTEPKQRGRK
jgi:hypothetical protein